MGSLQEFFSPSHRFYGINFGVNNCQIQGDQTAKLQNWMKHVARALQLAVHSDFSISRILPEPTIQDMHVFSALSFPGSKAVVKKKKKKRLTLNCNFKLCRRPAVSIASSSNFILRCCFSSLHQTLIYSAQPA